MRIIYQNFRPYGEQKQMIEREFSHFNHDLDLGSTLVINIKKEDEIYHAHATVLQNKNAVQSEMSARKLEIIAPSLALDLRSKLAWDAKRHRDQMQKYSGQTSNK